MTVTDTRTIEAIDLTVVIVCAWCKTRQAELVAVYDACRHNHLICGPCKRRQEQEQQVADEATPPRPLGHHGCCGARIYRASWWLL